MQNTNKYQTPSSEALRRKHETSGPAVGWIVFVVGLILLMMIGCLVVIGMLMEAFSRGHPEAKSEGNLSLIVAADQSPLKRFPQPNLQVTPHEDLEMLQKREDRELSSYGWIDKDAGVVRIPIERAMDLIIERGLPTRSTNQPVPADQSSYDLIDARSRNR